MITYTTKTWLNNVIATVNIPEGETIPSWMERDIIRNGYNVFETPGHGSRINHIVLACDHSNPHNPSKAQVEANVAFVENIARA
jgi:hypothetical protein